VNLYAVTDKFCASGRVIIIYIVSLNNVGCFFDVIVRGYVHGCVLVRNYDCSKKE